MLKYKHQNLKAFTLIELLTVISIIGILSTISVVSYNTVRTKERDNRRVTDMNKLSIGFENYRSLYGHYPVCDNGCDYGIPGSSSDYSNATFPDTSSPWFTCLGEKLKPFIGNIPSDPGNVPGRGYCYKYTANGTGDKISVTFFLESAKSIGGISNAIIDSDHSEKSLFNTINYRDRVW